MLANLDRTLLKELNGPDQVAAVFCITSADTAFIPPKQLKHPGTSLWPGTASTDPFPAPGPPQSPALLVVPWPAKHHNICHLLSFASGFHPSGLIKQLVESSRAKFRFIAVGFLGVRDSGERLREVQRMEAQDR